MGYLDEMARFDLRRGKEPINPTRIEGAGASLPLPPLPDEPPAIPSALERYGPPVELPPLPEDDIPSPLIPPRMPQERSQPMPEAGALPSFDPLQQTILDGGLVIRETQAVYRGQPVVLAEKECAEIKRIVLRAAQRRLSEQLAEVSAGLPKRGRRRKEAQAVTEPSLPLKRARKAKA